MRNIIDRSRKASRTSAADRGRWVTTRRLLGVVVVGTGLAAVAVIASITTGAEAGPDRRTEAADGGHFVVDPANLPEGYAKSKEDVETFIEERRAEAEANLKKPVTPLVELDAYRLSTECQERAGVNVLANPDDPTDYTVSFSVDPGASDPDGQAAAIRELLRRCRTVFEQGVAQALVADDREANDRRLLEVIRGCANDVGAVLPQPFATRGDIARISPAVWDEVSKCVSR